MEDTERSGSQELHDVDVAILGLGSAGEQTAKLLAAAGWSVVGFEPGRVGGECPFVACVPSKSLLHDAFNGADWADAVERRDDLVNHRNDSDHAEGLIDAGVTLVRELARIVGENVVESNGHRVVARHVVIATGAGATVPDIEGIDRESVWYSADVLSSSECPKQIVIIGGGPIGSELSEVFARFGSSVTLCQESDVLTDDAEPCVSSALREHLEDLGVAIHLDADVVAIEDGDDGSDAVRLVDGTTFPAERVLVAAGVSPRLDSIGLESIGLTPTSLQIQRDGSVADHDWLWAAGDVTPYSHWTHGATIQARALTSRVTGEAWAEPPSVMPRCIFTNPPLGVVGETAATARARGIDAVVGTASYADIVRAKTDEIENGVAAIVVDRVAGTILGASIFGPRADDIVQVVTAFMAGGVTIHQANRTVFPFPTLSQVIEAALDDAVSKIQEGQQ